MHTNTIIMHNNNYNKKNKSTTTTEDNNKKTHTRTNPAATVPQPRSHNSATQACAACKYRRRKCTSDCILAPYFPHDSQPQFLNAHRLFGVSNIVRIIGHLTPPERDIAMRTIIFESDARAADPIDGCYRIIRDLEHRISIATAELEIVLHHLAICRAAAAQWRTVVPPPSDGGDSYREKWAQNEVVTVDYADSWGRMNENLHAHDDQHGRRLSLEESTNDMISPILDNLASDDDYREGLNIDPNGDFTTSNDGILTEGNTLKEDDCLSYIEDHHDLIKTAVTFISLTN